MLDKIKEFIKENLGIIFGVTTIGLCVNIVLLFPVLGNQVSQLILNITLVFNLFPYPLNWLLFIPFVISVVACVIRILDKVLNTFKKLV